MSSQQHAVYIIVHEGDPLDYQKFRHTGLWIVPVSSGQGVYCHIVGGAGQFDYEEKKPGYNPNESRTFAKSIYVGTTRKSMKTGDVTKLAKKTEIKEWDPEFNCHQWVHGALTQMSDAKLLTKDECDEGVSNMIDATMEATDEP